MNDPRRQLAPVMSGKAQNESWYRVFAKGNKTATIELYDEIGIWGTTAKSFVNELKDLDTKTIELHINSLGGDAWDGIAIYNALRDHSAKVIVTVDGLAASAAGLVTMAGDEVIMNRHSELMIHEAWGMCMGNAEAMADMVTRLDKISANIAAVYADRAGGTVDCPSASPSTPHGTTSDRPR
ncbi:hypothetical protein DMP17_44845 [Pseudonocardia sp. TMWB2A]|uniref:head maturation protease, ClpP-related n=1 Tax=Pseudonocardia sp. TMWB2A TaxID=687430 RepID=UPI00307ED679